MRRRAVLLLPGLLLACSPSGPDQADALDQIRQRLRKQITEGQQQIVDLTYKSGKSQPDGSFAILVDYDIVALAPTIGLFNTVNGAGSRVHTQDERYVFVRQDGVWRLQ